MMARLAWIVAIVVGLAAGGFAFHFPGSYGNSVFDPSAAVFGLIIGSVNGLLLGVLASVALRLPRADGWRLLGFSVLSVGGTHAINDGTSTAIPFVLAEATAGLLVAGAAAWRLREGRLGVLFVVGAAWTIGIMLGSWTGNLLGLPFSETPIGWSMDHAWDGLVAGLVFGGAIAVVGLPETLRGPAVTGSMIPSGA